MALWLGKIVRQPDGTTNYFKAGPAEAPPNSAQPGRTRALWKLLADHAGHPLRVISEGEPGYNEIGEYVNIGDNEPNDVSFERYLENWRG